MDKTDYILGGKILNATVITEGEDIKIEETKSVEVTSNGVSLIEPDLGYDAIGSVELTTNVNPDLESKSVTITSNTTTTVTPTAGKDGLSSVEITTNVPKYAPYYVTFNGIELTNASYEVENLDVKNLTSFFNMFSYGNRLTSLDLSSWNNTIASSTYNMFYNCTSLTSINLGSGLTFENVTSASQMFGGCTHLTSMDLSNQNFASLTLINGMFSNCSALTTINFGNNFDTSAVTNASNMFGSSNNITTINFGNKFTLESATSMQNMFNYCTNLDDNTLNAILYICTTATSLNASNKKLSYLGITSSALTTKVPTLSNYQAFLDAGWTIS